MNRSPYCRWISVKFGCRSSFTIVISILSRTLALRLEPNGSDRNKVDKEVPTRFIGVVWADGQQ